MYATRTQKVKTDRRDSRVLRGRLAVRDALVRTRTGYIGLVRALLRRRGWPVPTEAFWDLVCIGVSWPVSRPPTVSQ